MTTPVQKKEKVPKKRIPFLLKFIPPPRFLEMKASGVDISDTCIRMVELDRGKGGYSVKQFGAENLPKGVIVNGDIQNKDEFQKKLNDFARKYNLHFVKVSLPEEKAYLFKTTIPRVPKKDMRGAVEFRLQENVPIALSEAVFDYTLLSGDEAHQDHYDAEVAVLPRKDVELYMEAFQKAGMRPLSFMIEAQAVMHAIIPRGDKGTYVIANVESQKTGLYIVSGEAIHFTSTIAFGGEMLTKVLAEHAKIDQTRAEELKSKEGLAQHHGNDELFFNLMSPVSALKDEIKKVLLYWENREGIDKETRNVSKIILCGKDSLVAGLDTYIAQSVKKQVVIGNVWSNVLSLSEEVPPIKYQDSLDYGGAIGAALPKIRI